MESETEEGKRLRVTVGDELEAVMKRHGVGGIVLLSSTSASSWRFVFPEWSCMQPDEKYGMRLRANSKEPGTHERLEATMHMIGSLRDMAADFGNVMGRMFRITRDALEAQGAVVEHHPFMGGSGIDPMSRRGQ